MIEINFGGGNILLIDAEDHSKIKPYKLWTSVLGKNRTHTYVMYNDNGNSSQVAKLIIGTKEGCVIDHINRNTLDNRKCNLRHVPQSINAVNRNSNSDKKSKLPKGVYRKRDKFQAQIRIDGCCHTLGTFSCVEEAAKAYEEAYRRRLNELTEG